MFKEEKRELKQSWQRYQRQLLSMFWMWLGLLLRKQEKSEKTILKNVKTSQFYRAPLCAQMSVSADKRAHVMRKCCVIIKGPFSLIFISVFFKCWSLARGGE